MCFNALTAEPWLSGLPPSFYKFPPSDQIKILILRSIPHAAAGFD